MNDESLVYEDNTLLINGNHLLKNIQLQVEKLSSRSNPTDFPVDDVFEPSIQSEVQSQIDSSTASVLAKKPLFASSRSEESLRKEAKNVKFACQSVSVESIDQIKNRKMADCKLNSFIFYDKLFTKAIGKDSNYVFDYRESLLNDMNGIDYSFFSQFFKKCALKDTSFEELDLVYEFAVYHPSTNLKTQQIALLGQCSLKDLKNKLYCVLNELQEDTFESFFFIETCFYNESSRRLSDQIVANRNLKPNAELGFPSLSEQSKSDFEAEFYSESNKYGSKHSSYSQFSMEQTIREMDLKVGYPYLFRHFDHCDHVVILQDVRLVDKFDRFTAENRAITTFQKKLKRRVCDICNLYFAKY